MKNLLLLFFATILLVGCEDLETNNPAMQGSIDDVFFKALDARAQENEDGSFTIQGNTQDELLTLHINSAQLGTYNLGEGETNYASFRDANDNVYHTSPNGKGKIVVTDNCDSCGFLSGTFSFSAIRQNIDTIRVHRGVFYEVSYIDGGIIDDDGQVNAGELIAVVNDDPFEANTVSAEVSGSTIVIEGTLDSRKITIEVPLSATSSNNPIPSEGYRAAYTNDDGTEEALSGMITVNFHNAENDHILIFFRFNTENNVITEGRVGVDY